MNAKSYLHEIVLCALLVVLLFVASLLKPNFLGVDRQLFLSRHVWETAILAIAMTPIIITGGIDLSVGSAMGMSAVAFGICFRYTHNILLSSAVCLITATLGGAFNGWLIARLKVHPLIITLATYAGFRGIAEGVSQGESYSQFGDTFGQLARYKLWDVPLPAFVFAALAISVSVVLAEAPLGRFIYAIGHNAEAARFSGVETNRVKYWLYTFSGFLAGLADVPVQSRARTVIR